MRIGFYCSAAAYTNERSYETKTYPAEGGMVIQLIGFLCAI